MKGMKVEGFLKEPWVFVFISFMFFINFINFISFLSSCWNSGFLSA